MTGDPPGGPLKPATRFSDYGRSTWGPYWDVLFGPAMVTAWINWKRSSRTERHDHQPQPDTGCHRRGFRRPTFGAR